MRRLLRISLCALALAELAACAGPGAHDDHAAAAPMMPMAPGAGMGPGRMAGGMMGAGWAVASLSPTQGSTVRGIVVFHTMGAQVMVHARITGLKPGAEHGFHIHDKGDCASTDGSSAGGHFNPAGKPHGPQTAEHHAGDLPALQADANGVADVRFTLSGVSVGDGAADIVARSVIVHAQPDDYQTQPTGNSGARLACGVIARSPHGG